MNAEGRPDKFRRYRERKRAAGLREVRLWVPDVRSAAFRVRLAVDVAALNGAAGERESVRFIEQLQSEQELDKG